jgi:hypothetical protein
MVAAVAQGDPVESVTASGEHEYKAALRVSSEALGLGELVALLGAPTRSHDIGDPVGRQGGVRRRAQWTLEAAVERTHPLEEHLTPLVAFAERHRSELASLRAQGCRADVFCGVFANPDAQGGWVFGPELSRSLAALELAVNFDLY